MRRTLAVVLIALSALIALPALIGLSGAAQAKGGPTSVLITQPGAERATALYYTSAEYAELTKLLTTESGLPGPRSASLRDAETYQLTWMIHDSEPWRRDSVMVARDGSVYVTTFGSDQVFMNAVVDTKLSRIAQGPELAAFLDEVFATTAAAPSTSTRAAPQPVIQQQPAAAPPVEETTRWFSLAGWRWAIPGVLGGLLVALVVTRQRSPREARRVLLDAEPVRASTTGA